MKILHLDPDDMDNPLSGGGPVRTFEIYRRLSQRHEITVLTPTFPGSSPEVVREGIRYLRLGRKIRDHGSSHHITFFFELPRAIRRMEYDLLVEDFMPPFSATFNPLFAKAPVVGSVQWFFAAALSRQYRLPFFLGERYGVRLYDNLIVLTEKMRQVLQERHPKGRIEVIPNGIDAQLFEEQAVHGDYILYLGRVDTGQKGVDLLLQAYARVPLGERLPLLLVGHCFQQAEVEALIRELALEDWVSMPGRKSGEDKLKLLREARFVCVPSREETFGMVITEACAVGKTVVFFDRPPMNEVASPACLAIPPFDVEGYSQALRKLSAAPVSALEAKAVVHREWARQFRWDTIARQQEAFYETAVKGSP